MGGEARRLSRNDTTYRRLARRYAPHGLFFAFDRATIDKLSDQVLLAFEFTGVVNRKNVRMVQ
jgi:hypothetical protein